MCRATEPDAENSRLFRELLPAPVHTMIEGYGTDPGVVILGAMVNENLAGAMVGRASRRTPEACNIECLLVSRPGTDGCRVELFLLRESEQRIRARGFRKMQLEVKLPSLSRQGPGRAAKNAPPQALYSHDGGILTLLRRAGWDRFSLQSTRFYAKPQSVTRERWYHLDVPDDYQLFPWSLLTAAEREQLSARTAQVPDSEDDYLDPLVVSDFDDHTSLGVRKTADGSIVGWMITEAVSSNLLCFRRLYITPGERNRGLFYPLLANSIQLCLGFKPYGTFAVESDNNKMRDVLIRMLGRHCQAILDCFYCSKQLAPDGGN